MSPSLRFAEGMKPVSQLVPRLSPGRSGERGCPGLGTHVRRDTSHWECVFVSLSFPVALSGVPGLWVWLTEDAEMLQALQVCTFQL